MFYIRLMTAGDLPLGMRLKEQAGWNQIEADWRRFMAMQPDGCFVAELNGAPVGTAVGCVFGPVAWLAMVLVDEGARGQGIGRALLEGALGFVEEHGATSVRLDATPLGQPLYERLGFEPQLSLVRYGGSLGAMPPPCDPSSSGRGQAAGVIRLRTASQLDYNSILDLDRDVTNTDRRKFLLRLFDEQPEVCVAEIYGLIEGYLAARPGSDALQLGPCIASPEAGELLLRDACTRFAGERAFLDLPASHNAAVRFAESIGLTSQRTLTRMCRGVPVCEDHARLWTSSGPELG